MNKALIAQLNPYMTNNQAPNTAIFANSSATAQPGQAGMS